jgi:serine protease Do
MRSSITPRCGVTGSLIFAGLVAAMSPLVTSLARAEANPAATAVAEQSKKSTAVNRSWLGVKVQSIDDDTAAALGLPEAKGALVSEVVPDGPAAASGLKGEDAIMAVNGQKIADGKDLARKIAEQDPTSTVDLELWRGHGQQTIKVKLGSLPGSKEETANQERADSQPTVESKKSGKLGLKLAPAEAVGAQEGVAIAEVDPESDAAEKGLTSGDIILRVDGTQVSNTEQVIESLKAVQNKGLKAVMLCVKSGEETRSIPVRFSVEG